MHVAGTSSKQAASKFPSHPSAIFKLFISRTVGWFCCTCSLNQRERCWLTNVNNKYNKHRQTKKKKKKKNNNNNSNKNNNNKRKQTEKKKNLKGRKGREKGP